MRAKRFTTFGPLTCLTLLTVMTAGTVRGAEDEANAAAIVVGTPQRVEVFPESIKLTGSRQRMRLVVTGHYADGSLQDLTHAAKYTSSGPEIATVSGGVTIPVADGQTDVVVSVGGVEVSVPVTITGAGRPEPISFQYDTLAALCKQGCNAGACHGSPSGKGGFRLSLRAFDSKLDKLTLIREAYGRRTNIMQPELSLMLMKPTMALAHGGGRRLKRTDVAYEVLHDWIGEGCRLDPEDAPKCVKIKVYPPSGRVLKQPARSQQLCVLAHFSDGSVRDITPLAVFTSSDEEVATVDVDGLVNGNDRGESAVIVRYLEFIETTFITFVKDIDGFVWSDPPAENYVDDLVHEKLQQLKFLPSELCTDDEFIRRVHLHVLGLLPAAEQVHDFLTDTSPDKRAKLIDSLLDQPEHSQFWALKWGDLLRLTTKQVSSAGVHKLYRWLNRAYETNMPYDEFARQLLTASGSTLVNPPANYYRTAGETTDRTETTAQLFLGARLQCAKCHNHPFERWTQDNYYGMAAFFNRVQRKNTQRQDEMVIWLARSGEVTQPRTGQQMKPWVPVVGALDVPADGDRRVSFVGWLTAPDNPFFGKVEVNRIWSHVMGRGIVDPVDDFRDSNPPSNAKLLEALASDFASHGFDRKHILRTILNSRTYQASSRTNEFNKNDERYFSHAQVKRLSAEQLLDAICQVTGVEEKLGGLPTGTKATQMPAPDIFKNDFLKIFGQPDRQTACECERSDESNLSQALQLFNGPLVHGKLQDKNNRFRKLVEAKKTNEEIVGQLYLVALCRQPTEAELETSLNHIQSKENRIEGLEDICWALINTNEFLFQH